jgi:hypothetical protein
MEDRIAHFVIQPLHLLGLLFLIVAGISMYRENSYTRLFGQSCRRARDFLVASGSVVLSWHYLRWLSILKITETLSDWLVSATGDKSLLHSKPLFLG